MELEPGVRVELTRGFTLLLTRQAQSATMRSWQRVGAQGGSRTHMSNRSTASHAAVYAIPPPARLKIGTGGGIRTLKNLSLSQARMPIPPPRLNIKSSIGAKGGTRNRNLSLTRRALSQLSYFGTVW